MEAIQTESIAGVDSTQKLLRILGVGFGVAVVVGGTIGVGILRAPGPIAAQLGTVWLIHLIWILGSFFTLMCANYTAELATMLPKAGGPYVYARHAFGNYGGFVVGWSDWFANTTPLAYLPIAFAEYSGQLFPTLQGKTTVIAVATLLVFTILNWIGLRLGSNTQKLISLLKFTALLTFVAACFIFGGQKTTTAAAIATPNTFAQIFVASALAFQLVALAITVLLAFLLILTGTFEKLFVIYAFFATANTIILIGALFILRKREPNLARPFKTWGYPWLPIFLMVISFILFVSFVISDFKNALYPLLLIAGSIPIYLLLFKKKAMNHF